MVKMMDFEESYISNCLAKASSDDPEDNPEIKINSNFTPRDTCYVASPGLPELRYSGYQPHAYSWDDYSPLKDILEAVHKALPGSSFNSLLLNRYKVGTDYVAWHSDDEKLYGANPRDCISLPWVRARVPIEEDK